MSTRPAAPGSPEAPFWVRALISLGALLFFTGVASVPLFGLYALNVQIAAAFNGFVK
jgi:hypothetical protein